MKTIFLLLRIATGLMAVAGLLILLMIILLRSGAAFMKESVGAIGYVFSLFTSGFTKGTSPESQGWIVSLPQAGLAVLFIAMIASVFQPGARIFLHLTASASGIALFWYVRMLMTGVKLEIFCLPLILVWYVFYAMCLCWFRHQPVPIAPTLP